MSSFAATICQVCLLLACCDAHVDLQIAREARMCFAAATASFHAAQSMWCLRVMKPEWTPSSPASRGSLFLAVLSWV